MLNFTAAAANGNLQLESLASDDMQYLNLSQRFCNSRLIQSQEDETSEFVAI